MKSKMRCHGSPSPESHVSAGYADRRRAAWRIAEILYPRQFDPLPLTYRGPWRYRVGKRNGKRILAALSELPVEGRLFG
jgi:hypothetical protein